MQLIGVVNLRYLHCKKICKFNLTKSMKFTKLVHWSEINVLCTLNLQIFGEFNVGESRQPWAGVSLEQIVFFFKYERKNLEFFTWCRESDFGNLYSSLIEKIVFSSLKKIDFIFKGQK